MGNVLDAPIEAKETMGGTIYSHHHKDGEEDEQVVKYSVSSMQGWRPTMEDSHLIDTHLFYPPFEKRRKKELLQRSKNELLQQQQQQQQQQDQQEEKEEQNCCSTQKNRRQSLRLRQGKQKVRDTTKSDDSDASGDLRNNSKRSQLPNLRNLFHHHHHHHHHKFPSTSQRGGSHGSSSQVPYMPIPNHALFAVFDGHGGSDAALYASRYFASVLCHTKEFQLYVQKYVHLEYTVREEDGKLEKEGGEKKRKKKKRQEQKKCRKIRNDKNSAASSSSSSKQKKSSKGEKNANHDEEDNVEDEEEELTLLKKALYKSFVQIDAHFLIHILQQNKTQHEKLQKEKKNRSKQQQQTQQQSPRRKSNNGMYVDEFTKEDAGTTAVVVLLTPKFILCANAGDARAILCRNEPSSDSDSSSVATDVTVDGDNAKTSTTLTTNDNKTKNGVNLDVKQLSLDHKPEDPEEMVRILDADGSIIGGRVDGELAVARAIGDFKFKYRPCVLSCASYEEEDDESTTDDGDSGDKEEEKEDKDKGEKKKAKKSKSQLKIQDKKEEMQALLHYWNILPSANPETTVRKSSNFDDADSMSTVVPKIITKPEQQKVCATPYISTHHRHGEDDVCMVLACDGIWDVMKNEDCWEVIRGLWVEDGEEDLTLINEELLDICLKKGSQDNMTAMIVQFPAFQKIFSKQHSTLHKSGGGGGGGVARRRRNRQIEKMEKALKNMST